MSGFIIGFFKNWRVALVMTAGTPVCGLAFVCMITILTHNAKRKIEGYAKAGGVATEALVSMRTVTSLGLEQRVCSTSSPPLRLFRRLPCFPPSTHVLHFTLYTAPLLTPPTSFPDSLLLLVSLTAPSSPMTPPDSSRLLPAPICLLPPSSSLLPPPNHRLADGQIIQNYESHLHQSKMADIRASPVNGFATGLALASILLLQVSSFPPVPNPFLPPPIAQLYEPLPSAALPSVLLCGSVHSWVELEVGLGLGSELTLGWL